MAKKKFVRGTCELCERIEVETTVHHLTPREMGGSFLPTAALCIPCHKQIHALYTNEELAVRLNTILLLKDDPKLAAYIKWIQKQPSSKIPLTKKSNERKKHRKK